MSIVESLIFYLSIFFISTFFAYFLSLSYTKLRLVGPYSRFWIHIVRGLFFTLTCAPLVYIFTVRNNVGVDYHTYEVMYYQYISWGFNLDSILNVDKELGYGFINLLGYQLFDDFRGVLFLSALLVVVPVLVGLRCFNPAKIHYGWLVYLLTLFLSSFNGTRQHISVSFCLLAIVLAYKSHYLKSVLLIVVAYFFHAPSIFTVVFYGLLLLCKKNAKGKLTWLIPTFVIIDCLGGYLLNLLSGIPLIQIYYLKYMDTIGQVTIMHFVTHTLFKLPFTIICLWCINQLITRNKENLTLFIYTLFDYSFIAASYYIRWAIRMQYYTMIAAPLLVMEISELKNSKIHPQVLIGIIFLVLIIRFLLLFGYSGFDGVVPYNFL